MVAPAGVEGARSERLVVEGCMLVRPEGESSGQVIVGATSVAFFAIDAAHSCTWFVLSL